MAQPEIGLKWLQVMGETGPKEPPPRWPEIEKTKTTRLLDCRCLFETRQRCGELFCIYTYYILLYMRSMWGLPSTRVSTSNCALILLSQEASLLPSDTSAWRWSSTLWMFYTLTILHKTSLFSYVIVSQNLSEVQKRFTFYPFPSELLQRSLFSPHSPSEITDFGHVTCSTIYF